jgi:heterodisulfide reductase subunit A2
MINKTVIIIGGGPAGIEAAAKLSQNNIKVILLEKEDQIGGHIKNTHKLFPNFEDSEQIMDSFNSKLQNKYIDLKLNTEIDNIGKENNLWVAKSKSGDSFNGDAIILASGFRLFDAVYKEELGYGLYEDVITSVEFEQMYKTGTIRKADGSEPKRIAFLNCVGSRDEKVGNHYCSRVCCINSVKLSIEAKESLPDCEVFCFYMDIRMSGQFYEELYRKSQEKYNVNYIRGRISEASRTIDNKIQIKAEDTLSRLPLKMTVDMLVLMIGIESSEGTTRLAEQVGIVGEYGFAKSTSLFISDNITNVDGLFLAGVCKRPLTLPETMADARAAAMVTLDYLNKNQINKSINK